MTDKEKIQKLITDYGGTQEKFAEFLGVAVSTVANWKFRNKLSQISKNLILRRCPDVNIDWLEGTSDVYRAIPQDQKDCRRLYEGIEVNNGEITHTENQDGKLRKFLVPDSPAAEFIRVSGCSLQPTILAGDIIGIHEILDWNEREYNKDEIFFIIMEDSSRYLKRIYGNEEKDVLLGYSENPTTLPIQIPKDKIVRVYMVDVTCRMFTKSC